MACPVEKGQEKNHKRPIHTIGGTSRGYLFYSGAELSLRIPHTF